MRKSVFIQQDSYGLMLLLGSVNKWGNVIKMTSSSLSQALSSALVMISFCLHHNQSGDVGTDPFLSPLLRRMSWTRRDQITYPFP